MYQFSVSEGAAVGTPVGRVIATDADMGDNTDMSYLIKEGGDLFKVTTDVETQEAVVSIKKVQFIHRKSALLLLSFKLVFVFSSTEAATLTYSFISIIVVTPSGHQCQ